MQAKVIIPIVHRISLVLLLVFTLLLSPLAIHAQVNESLETPGAYLPEELAQMLAPVALFPDPLLSQILMAATYPIEIVEADRWVRKYPDLEDEALDAALLRQDWDPSVKALCHFPTVLGQMSERISETTKLGNAFLAQEDEVMDMVQELRAKAYAQGNLNNANQQKVIVEKETIIIEPADPRVVYVPYYDPLYVYGPWLFPTYPPYFWGPSRVRAGVGISFGSGIYFGFSFGSWSYFDWPHRHIFLQVQHRPRFVRHDRWITRSGSWTHIPRHRRGVAYRERSTAQKYGQYPQHHREFPRQIRGYPEDNGWRDSDQRRTGGWETDRDRQRRETRDRQKKALKQSENTRKTQHWSENRKSPGEKTDSNLNRTGKEKPPREGKWIAPKQPKKSRENIFERVEEGKREQRSSDRGRSSRQGWQKDTRSQGKSEGNERREKDGREGRKREKKSDDSLGKETERNDRD